MIALVGAEWLVTYALELHSVDPLIKDFWNKMQYLGVVVVPTAWLIFALRYTNREKWLTHRNLILLSIVPGLTLLAVFTNEAHGLFWERGVLNVDGSLSVVSRPHGVGFWIHIAYTYLLILAVILLSVQMWIRSRHLYRRQAGLLLFVALFPVLGNMFVLSGLNPFPYFDWTSLFFTAANLILTWSFFHLRVGDIVPVAREVVIESMGDGVIVLDEQNRIIDLNSVAQDIIGHTAAETMGKPIEQVQPHWLDLIQCSCEKNGTREEIVVGKGDTKRIYDVRVSPIVDWRGRLTSQVFVLRDITERKHAENALLQHAIQLETLRKVGLKLTAQLNLDTLLRSIVSQAMDLLGGNEGGLYLYRPEQDALEWTVSTGPDTVAPNRAILHRGEGLFGKVWETGEPFIVDDYSNWKGQATAWQDYAVTSVVGVPVCCGEEFMGVLSITADAPRIFSLTDADTLSLFASQAAIAIQNARLFEMERQRTVQLAAVAKVAEQITSILNLSDLLHATVELIGQTFDYYHVLLMLLDRETGELVFKVGRGTHARKLFVGFRQQMKQGMIGWTAYLGKTLLANDVNQEPRYIPIHPETKSELDIPLKCRDKVLGVLDIQSEKPNAFSQHDVMALETLAGHIAVAVENAQLYEQAQREIIEREQAEQALWIKNAAMESAITAIALADLEGKLTYVNHAFLTMWGYDERQSVLGKHVADFWQVTDRIAKVIQALEEIGGWIGKLGAKRQDGSTFPALVSASLVENDAGKPVQMMGSFVDMTHREKTNEMLQRHVERLEILRDIDGAILAAKSPEEIAQAALAHIRRLVPCQRASVSLFDFEANEFFVLAVQSESESKAETEGERLPLKGLEEIIKALEQGKAYLVDYDQSLSALPTAVQVLQVDGLHALLGVPIRLQKELIGALALWSRYTGALGLEHIQVAQEVANSLAIAIQHARLFGSVMQQRERLHILTTRLSEAEEAERRRLAQVLHDQIGQNLTVLGLNLNLIRAQLAQQAPSLILARLDDSLALVEETTERTRHVMTDLRPPMLDDYGLIYTLRWYGEQFTSRTGVAVTIQGKEPVPRLAAPVENLFFRITQEALTNVTKHAQASQVTITVTADEQDVHLVIADDGVGFDQTQLAASGKARGWGLLTMTERAEAIGAHCRIESRLQRGTQVIVEAAR